MRFTSYFAIFFGSSERTGSFCCVGSVESSSGSEVGVCAFEQMAATSTAITHRRLRKISRWRLTSRAEQNCMGPPHWERRGFYNGLRSSGNEKMRQMAQSSRLLADCRLKALQEGIGISHSREELFLGLELRGVDAAAAAAQLDGVLQVEHLVVNDVFQHVPRHGGMVEDTADD